MSAAILFVHQGKAKYPKIIFWTNQKFFGQIENSLDWKLLLQVWKGLKKVFQMVFVFLVAILGRPCFDFGLRIKFNGALFAS